METGILLDHSYGSVTRPAWVAGIPKWTWWSGLKLKGIPKFPVTTYRCPRCGRLESYAQEGSWPG